MIALRAFCLAGLVATWQVALAQSDAFMREIDAQLLAADRVSGPKHQVPTSKISLFGQIDLVKRPKQDMYHFVAFQAIKMGDLSILGRSAEIMFPTHHRDLNFEKNGAGYRRMAERADATALDIVCYIAFLENCFIEDGKYLVRYTEPKIIEPAKNGRGPTTLVRRIDTGYKKRRSELDALLSKHCGKSWLANAFLGPRRQNRSELLTHMENAYKLGVPPLWAKYLYGNLLNWQMLKTDSPAEVERTKVMLDKYLAILTKHNVFIPKPFKKSG